MGAETYLTANHRYYNLQNRFYKDKTVAGMQCLRMYGYSELNLDNIPPKFMHKIRKSIERGFASAQSGIWPYLLTQIVVNNPVVTTRIGYMGKLRFELYYPQGPKVKVFFEELRALAELCQDFDASSIGQQQINKLRLTKISCRLRAGTKHRPLHAHFKTVRRLAEQQMGDSLSHRQPLLDWLSKRETIRLPFASHDKDWANR